MTGLNHAVTGAVVAVAVKRPELALPAAFLSHFAIDMLPHWDYEVPGHHNIRRLVIGTDLLASAWVIIVLSILLPDHGWLAFFGGSLAILPDTMWLPYILYNQDSPMHERSVLHLSRRLHSKIQWGESSIGLAVEIFWFALMFLLLIRITVI